MLCLFGTCIGVLTALARLVTGLPLWPAVRWWCSACLVAVSAMAVAYVSGVVGQQNGMLLSFAVLLLIGALRARGCCQLPETAAQPQVITVGTSMPVRCLISAS